MAKWFMRRLTPKMIGLSLVMGERQELLCGVHDGVVVAATKTRLCLADWESRHEDPLGHYTNTLGGLSEVSGGCLG